MNDKVWQGVEYENPLTMEGLITWLEQQPSDGEYDYEDCSGGCLLGLYLGIRSRDAYINFSRTNHPLEFLAYGIACERPWTFGAALKRACGRTPECL